MRKLGIITASFALFSWAACAQGNNGNGEGAKSQELQNAAQTVTQMTSSSEIPKQLIQESQCIGVIPNLTKGALIVGGEHGAGVLSCRDGQGWSAPAFFNLSGGSIGLQAGASSSKIVLLMNQQGKQEMLNGTFQLSANAVAEGPNGSNYTASAGWKAPVLAYKQSNGAFAGLNVKGSTINVDQDAIHKVYGSSSTAKELLNGSVQVPQQAQSFVSALRQSATAG